MPRNSCVPLRGSCVACYVRYLTIFVHVVQIVTKRHSPAHEAGVRGRVGRVRGRGAGAGGAERRGAGVRGRHVLPGRGRRAAAARRRRTHCAVHAASSFGILFSFFCIIKFQIMKSYLNGKVTSWLIFSIVSKATTKIKSFNTQDIGHLNIFSLSVLFIVFLKA